MLEQLISAVKGFFTDLACVGLVLVVPPHVVISIATRCEILTTTLEFTGVLFAALVHPYVLVQVPVLLEPFVAQNTCFGIYPRAKV